MTDILPEETERFVRAALPEASETQKAMEERGEGFPTVGREVGQFLRLLAHAVDVERIFEFGSGFGYSAYWFADALPEDGEIVLTEYDADELHEARQFLESAGVADRAIFENGDAMDTIERHDGPFDVVLIDHNKDGYPEALKAVRDKVAPGGVIVADNAMVSGIQDFDAILAALEGDDPELDEDSRGIAEYLLTMREDEAFETSVIPLGEGIAVSYRR
ncbi:O-methyltransferase [Haladaptatus pallidirubidus]|uniref:O-methyltransferase n=1 Tax=Haladaptatus pallidirubidus TaxID=1008152 RepID=A0AAV3UH29_9EURY|nr:O-methyltransferase [Haladaptatus pallidirubidus]